MIFLFTLFILGLILYVVFSIVGVIMLPLVGFVISIAVVLSIVGIVLKIVFSKFMLTLILIVALIYFFNKKKH